MDALTVGSAQEAVPSVGPRQRSAATVSTQSRPSVANDTVQLGRYASGIPANAPAAMTTDQKLGQALRDSLWDSDALAQALIRTLRHHGTKEDAARIRGVGLTRQDVARIGPAGMARVLESLLTGNISRDELQDANTFVGWIRQHGQLDDVVRNFHVGGSMWKRASIETITTPENGVFKATSGGDLRVSAAPHLLELHRLLTEQ